MALSIGLIGFGALGGSIHRILGTISGCRVSGVFTHARVDSLSDDLQAESFEQFLEMGHDVIVECAGQAALKQYGLAVLKSGAHLVTASVGSLVDDELRNGLLKAASESGVSVRLPSGAMVGIDGLAAARHVGIESAVYRGTMHPDALRNYESDAAIAGRTKIYVGTARDAVARFPKNANLTGTIALAGIGFDRTKVELYLDPALTANMHELEVHGDFGHFQVQVVGKRISDASPSSRIVAGSLAQAALGSSFTTLS